MTLSLQFSEPFKTGLKVTLAVLIAVAIIPILAVAGWAGRFVFLVAVPTAALALMLSPRVRTWLLADATEEQEEEAPTVEHYKGLAVASDVLLHPHHAWAREGKCGELTVGVDELLCRTLGPVTGVRLPAVGQEVEAGQPIFQVRSGGRTLEVKAPVEGKVMWTNSRLRTDPGLLNRSPYQGGWTVVLWPRRNATSVDHLRRRGDALAWFRAEVDRLLGHVAPADLQTATMQDGGPIADDLHLQFDARAWRDVRRSFFGQDEGTDRDGPEDVDERR